MPDFYCGPASAPEALAGAWNFDFIALTLFALGVAAFLRLQHPRQNAAFWPASVLFLLLFVSPICTLTASLFSARVVHHLLLITIVAPLLAIAFSREAGTAKRVPLSLLVGLHAAIVWLWHAPSIYEVAISGAIAYWTMQLSLLGSGFLMWRRILAESTATGPALLALLASVVQMGMLGALLTFAREPLYAPHFTTTLPYGLTSIADQQLAGLIMWVPAALPYLVAASIILADRLNRGALPASRR